MDKFDNAVRKNIYEFKKSDARLISQNPNYSGKNYYRLNLSYDNFNRFALEISNMKAELPFNIVLYDESIIEKNEDLQRVKRLLNKLNQLNINSIKFYLSDNTLYYYNLLMNEVNWKHSNETSIYLSIDRNPTKRKPKDLNLDIAKGKLMINEEKLLWFSDDTLVKLKDRVDQRVLNYAYHLKDVALEFYKYIDANYDIKYLSDYDKMLIAYEYIREVLKIKFAHKYTTIINNEYCLVEPRPDYISNPLGTYLNKEGVCEGQARLMRVLLNNKLLKMDAVTLEGHCPRGEHAWVGLLINDNLFECCPTMLGPFKNLANAGYIINDYDVYSKVYRRNYLSEQEINKVRNHVKRLKKEGR